MLQPKDHSDLSVTYLAMLNAMRAHSGSRLTQGLDEATIARFLDSDASLRQAVTDAAAVHEDLRRKEASAVAMDEAALVEYLQHSLINFYPADVVNRYVAIAASGPWIITSTGAVLHDSGGYGMLGFGHSPQTILEAMNQRQVMANVMTPAFSQRRFTDALRAEVGHTRKDGCPYKRFACLNSGSEAMTVALRVADINAKNQTDEGGRHAGRPIRRVTLENSFHGRTDGPARYSDSTHGKYLDHLASFRDGAGPITIEPNNIEQLREVFGMAEDEGYFIEALCMEPVMGEGNPGKALTREFYDVAHQLSRDHGALLIIDSIQAGLRAHGCLSITDYPGFADCDAPDMESYSKALNAGQYPLSVLALSPRAAGIYRVGIYGNTMTANPRALDVACSVMANIDDALRQNISERGAEFVTKLNSLRLSTDGAITEVQGTGLLVSCELDDQRYKCYGTDSIEEYLRTNGIGVVHGGQHSLRFTPPFTITSAEIDLIINALADALENGPRKHR